MKTKTFYYWNDVINIGDQYNNWLFKKLYSNTINFNHTNNNADIIGTGSILCHTAVDKHTLICGSGWHNYSDKDFFKGSISNVLGLRGELSKQKLQIKKDICLGDPGLLVSKFYTPVVEKQYDYGLICHWSEVDFFINKYSWSKLKIISTKTDNVEQFINEVLSCRFIFSTSLHGIIFAHAYNIPAVHLEFKPLESRDNFKFKDYYSILNIDYKKLKYDNKFNFYETHSKITDFNPYCPTIETISHIQNNLLNMFNEAAIRMENDVRSNSVCLCAIAKNENHYIKEWIDWYKKLNFNQIVIYDNNDIDGERFEEVIADDIASGYVKIIDVRGLSNQQIMRYNEFYHSDLCSQFDWVAYFDIDEFLNINVDTIQDFLNSARFIEYDAIAVNWKYFDDNNIVTINGNYNVVSRFTHAYIERDWKFAQCHFSKRIIRTNNPTVCINSSHGAIKSSEWTEYHQIGTNSIAVCNTDGHSVNNTIYFDNWTHNTAYLAHYRYKTIEEYITNKMKRGYPTLFKNSGKDLNVAEFFQYNKKTPEKEKIVQKYNSKKSK